MRGKIAVATVSGKAYYLLVNELKRRSVPFLSLTPTDKIPSHVKVIITTAAERSRITHQNILEYDEDENPAEIVDEAIRTAKGKRVYEKLVIGVDPGENFGLAILGDGNILQTRNCRNLLQTVEAINEVVTHVPANQKIVRIGNGVPSYLEELTRLLNDTLPETITIESVREEGTSRSLGEASNRRERKDVSSAVQIGLRHGRALPRRKDHDYKS